MFGSSSGTTSRPSTSRPSGGYKPRPGLGGGTGGGYRPSSRPGGGTRPVGGGGGRPTSRPGGRPGRPNYDENGSFAANDLNDDFGLFEGSPSTRPPSGGRPGGGGGIHIGKKSFADIKGPLA